MTLLLTLVESARRDVPIAGQHLIIGTVAAALAVFCVLFHYEGMNQLSRFLPRCGLPRRARIVVVILGMLFIHVLEVWFFAITYYILDFWPSLGHVEGAFNEGALDFLYFSVVTYTSLGFGDMLPLGAIRILSGTETLVGLSLITWTASFAFLEMQRDWHEFHRDLTKGRKAPEEERDPTAE